MGMWITDLNIIMQGCFFYKTSPHAHFYMEKKKGVTP
jgi:hypothetical protein